MQPDGNLVVYPDHSSGAIWDSATSGCTGAYATILLLDPEILRDIAPKLRFGLARHDSPWPSQSHVFSPPSQLRSFRMYTREKFSLERRSYSTYPILE